MAIKPNPKQASRPLPAPVRRAQKQATPRDSFVAAPVAQSRLMKASRPVYRVMGSDGSVVVRHREYLADLLGYSAFTNLQFPINPGMATSFPWLSNVARSYESYHFRSLKFLYETEIATSSSGKVMLAVDYDAADAAPVSKVQMLSNHTSIPRPVWSEAVLSCDQADLAKCSKQLYVRSGSLASNLDIKTYDVGNLNVAFQGCSVTTVNGELYVEYEVELHTPQLDPTALALAGSLKITGASSVSKTAIFGVAPTYVGGLGATAVTNTITFTQPGQYLVSLLLTGTTLTDGSGSLGGTASAATLIGQYAIADATLGQSMVRVNVPDSGMTLSIDMSALAATVTASIARISSYAYASA